KAPWRERKEAHIAHATTVSAATKLVLAADKLHNARATIADVRDVGPLAWTRFRATPPEIAWYYRTMFEVIEAALPAKLRSEVAEAVATLEALAAPSEDASTP